MHFIFEPSPDVGLCPHMLIFQHYLLTPSSHLLVSGETMNVIPFINLEVDPMMTGASQVIGSWFKSPKASPFELFHSKGLWEMTSERPKLNKMINEGMASGSRLVCDTVLMTCGHVFRGLKSIVDVGGGTGTMARAIPRAFPEIKCTVLDLPHVVDSLKEEDSVVEYVGGDMFVSVPHANAVLLKWILHDWNDEECVKILRCCKDAIPVKDMGGNIIIIDMVVDATIDDKHAVETQLYFDLLCTPPEKKGRKVNGGVYFWLQASTSTKSLLMETSNQLLSYILEN